MGHAGSFCAMTIPSYIMADAIDGEACVQTNNCWVIINSTRLALRGIVVRLCQLRYATCFCFSVFLCSVFNSRLQRQPVRIYTTCFVVQFFCVQNSFQQSTRISLPSAYTQSVISEEVEIPNFKKPNHTNNGFLTYYFETVQ